ncbi:4-(cytidine 5'-diphospho)-2-C-methyl-D-erythritol kinase [Isobaculum melis]|nr:4-(cytidine 5'-diphospho)-2-C-methyl-D-erythritol kinase [Isobaculum melis]
MEVNVKAPAKINLSLDALYKREDGYHELEMVMTTIDLSDRIRIRKIDEDKIVLKASTGMLPLDKRNHVYQAAKLLKNQFQITQGVEIFIEKNIPISAGLAGGSTDAAATLRGLNELWDLALSLEELAEIGAQVGSDVPYCIYGGTAFVTGRGECIKQIADIPQCWVVLVKPRAGVSTASVFGALSFNKIEHPDTSGMIQAIEAQSYAGMVSCLGNVLEQVTIARHPDIDRIKLKMMQFGADAALMSGSGPTVFCLCEKYSRAQRVYNGLKGFCDEVYLVRSLK